MDLRVVNPFDLRVAQALFSACTSTVSAALVVSIYSRIIVG